MKRPLLLVLLVASFAAMAGTNPPPGWLSDVGEAKKSAEEKNLPVMILFSGTDWCPPCMRMRRILDKPAFAREASKEYVLLYVHVSRGWEIPKFFEFVPGGVPYVPYCIVADKTISKVLTSPAGRSDRRFLEILEKAARE